MSQPAVLLLAFGGPNSLQGVPEFVQSVRGDQPVPQAIVDEMTRRYRLIGGGSPLIEITRRLAAKLQGRVDLPVYIGMRHSQPLIAETVKEMARAGVTDALAICMAPHYSALSIGAYRAKLDEARQGIDLGIEFVQAWHMQPDYLRGLAQNIRTTLSHCAPNPCILFSAHSLPAAAREPYESQLRETARWLAHELGLREDRWMLCYQSAPRGATGWLQPQIDHVLPQLAQAGEEELLVAPIGFVADHLEVLYDIDIELQASAAAQHVRVVRTLMLNDGAALVQALGALVQEWTASRGEVRGATRAEMVGVG